MQIREDEMHPPGAAAVVPVNGLSFIHRTVTMTSYFNQVPPPPPLLRSLSARSAFEWVMFLMDDEAQFEMRKTKK